MEHILFLTGRLAEKALHRVLQSIEPPLFTWQVREIGVQVAALMTAELIRRRLPPPLQVDRVIVPGRCRGDLQSLSGQFGIPFERGPEDLKDLPQFFNRKAKPVDLSAFDIDIFAEIVDAPRLTVDEICARAREFRDEGADVIDLGGLPETPFAHLEEAVGALQAEGFRVSVDSMDSEELLRGGRAGADFLLSLNLDTLWIADEVGSTPVLVSREPGDDTSLFEAIDRLERAGRRYLADPILDPLPFGLLASLCRYQRLRERYPAAPILVGIGNLTELTEADTSGINALLLGICAELHASAILTTQVSNHARRAIREADVARRLMFAAREQRTLPKGFTDQLMTVHARQPYSDTPEEIAEIAAQIRDPNFRVQVASDGIHVYNRDGHHVESGAFALWPRLQLEQDGSHAFYMGVELAHAESAFRLGKRYVQDQDLDWGCAVPRGAAEDLESWCAPGTTMKRPSDPQP
ncbi:MAG: dihydropteroate synthase [Lautropia sp.]|nr:dihydropteroate synthase [Lautropia sp.]